MDAPRDLFLTVEFRLCESGSPEAAFLFHRQGQVITTQEEATYAVSAYLERTARQSERAERQRILAEVKAVEFAAVENKAVAGPGDTAPLLTSEENPIPPVRPEALDVRRSGGGRRG